MLAEGFHSWMWRGLGFVIPFLIVGYVSVKSIVHYALAMNDLRLQALASIVQIINNYWMRFL